MLDSQTISNIAGIYNEVLDRDPASADLVAAQTELATGAGLGGLMSWLANSAELKSDMASTYAAVASGLNLTLLNAQPQFIVPTGGSAPTQADPTPSPTQCPPVTPRRSSYTRSIPGAARDRACGHQRHQPAGRTAGAGDGSGRREPRPATRGRHPGPVRLHRSAGHLPLFPRRAADAGDLIRHRRLQPLHAV